MTVLSAAGGSEDDPPKDEQVIEDAIRGSAGRKRVSLSRLAKDAHVQRQTIYNWFEGVVPEPETWGRVAERLDLPPLDQLLTRRRATQTADPVADAIRANTDMLKAVLDVLTARLPTPPAGPPSNVLAEVSSAERRSAKAGSATLPRTPGPDHRGAGKATRRRSVDRA